MGTEVEKDLASLRLSDNSARASVEAVAVNHANGARLSNQLDGHDNSRSSLSFAVDPAILAALSDQHKERALVLRMEEDILAFLNDVTRDIFEFPVEFSNYQRMLAHKVSQYYGLQTSTADCEGNQCRVVAHRMGPHDKKRPLLASLDVSQGHAALAASVRSASSTFQEAPRLLRRPGSNRYHDSRPGMSHDNGVGGMGNHNSARSARDRDEEYERARARILNDGDSSASPSLSGPGSARSSGRGGYGGRGAFMPGRGRGRGRMDRYADMQYESDYSRGMPRYGMMYEGAQPMGPMFMAPPGTPMMYAAVPHQEVQWGAMYVPGRQPPPPPPSAQAAAGGTTPGGGGGAVTAVQHHAGKAGTLTSNTTGGYHSSTPQHSSQVGPGTSSSNQQQQPGSGTTTTTTSMHSQQGGSGVGGNGAPPPPPPPPHGASPRPFVPHTAVGPAMAMYPGGMQAVHVPTGPVITYAMYPAGAFPAPVHPSAYPPGAVAAYPGVQMAAYHSPAAVHAAYPGAVQVAPQGYGAVYAPAGAASAGGAVGGTSPGMHHAIAARPAGPGTATAVPMAYAPMSAMPGFAGAMPYPVATMQQAGAPGPAAMQYSHSAVVTQASAAAAAAAAGTGFHGSGGMGGRGGRGGYGGGRGGGRGGPSAVPPDNAH